MSAPRLSWLLEGLAEVPAAQDRAVSALTADSRTVVPGGLFLACRGTENHGLDWLDEALAQGAAAVVWEPCARYTRAPACDVPTIAVPGLAAQVGEIAARYYDHPTRKLFVLGVTGTDGKTSCVHLFAQAATALGQRCAMLGTIGNGFPGALQPATHTTPDPVSVQRWFAELQAAGARALAMEVSSHALDQGRVAGVVFDAAVFTNLSHDHLDYHGDLVNYARAKRRLLEREELSAVLLNIDDAWGRHWAESLAAQRRVIAYTLGTEPVAGEHLRACDVVQDPAGLSFRLCGSWGEVTVRSGLLGRFNVYNLVAVAGALCVAGHGLEAIAGALAAVQTVPGRMEGFRSSAGGPLVVVDYAHTPAALDAALTALAAHTAGELWCVFGCGGDRDRAKRPRMAAAAARHADHLVITDDNPRSEAPDAIVAEIVGGLPAGVDSRVIHERATAIDHALAQAGDGDVVLVAGKGHEDYQIIGDQRRSFSDRAFVASRLGQELGRWTA